MLTKNYESHPWASPIFRKHIFFFAALVSGILLAAMSTNSSLFQPHQDRGRTRSKFKELTATLPTEKEKTIECLEEGGRSV